MSEEKKDDLTETRNWLQAVGWFVTMFSIVEQHVHQTLWQVANVEPAIARCIFPTRMDAALDQLKRISEATQWETTQKGFVRKTLLDKVRKDLGDINRLRNDLLHYGISGTGDTPNAVVITNEKYAHVKSRIRKTQVSAAMLNDLGTQLIVHMWTLAVIRGEIDINTILPDRLKLTEA
jgi:hypothetical protein